jgi:Fungal fucose-specific lectin
MAGATLLSFGMVAQPALAAAKPAAPAESLAVSPALQRHLMTLYATYRHIPVSDIAAIPAGSARGTRISRTGADWASIGFLPSARAPQATQVGFQDGGGYGIFARAPGGRWKIAGLGGEPFGCGTSIPAQVRRAWQLARCATAASAPAAPSIAAKGTMSGLASLARSEVGVADTPPDPSAGEAGDCDPFTTLEKVGAPSANCGTDPKFHVRDEAEFWCADFTKWVWGDAGVTSDLGTLSPAAASFYNWGKNHGESMPEDQNPKTAQVGDAVVFYPGTAPNGTYASHVGIVVGVNSNGTLNLVNGDFFGNGTYSVQYNVTSPNLAAWANAVWPPQNPQQKPEDWMFVSPQLATSSPPTLYPSGGPVVYDPTDKAVEVYSVGSDGQVQENWHTSSPNAWHKGQLPMTESKVTGTPSAVYDPVDKAVEVYAAGADGQVQEVWHTSSPAGWHTGQLAFTGSDAVGSPSAVYDPVDKAVEVYFAGKDGQVQENWHTSSPAGWHDGQLALTNSDAVGSPSAVYDPVYKSIEVYSAGADGQVQENWHTSSGVWNTGQLAYTGSDVVGSPSAVYDPVDKAMEIYSAGKDGQVQENWHTSSGVWNTGQLTYTGHPVNGATSAVYDLTDKAIEVYADGSDGQLQEVWHTNSPGIWHTGQLAFTGSDAVGSPAALYDPTDSAMEIYDAGKDGQVQENWHTNSPGTWHTGQLAIASSPVTGT